MGKALPSTSSYESGNQSPMGNHIYHCQLFCQPQRVVPYRLDISENYDLCFFCYARQYGRSNVGDTLHTEWSTVMFIQHQCIEPHFFRVNFFV